MSDEQTKEFLTLHYLGDYDETEHLSKFSSNDAARLDMPDFTQGVCEDGAVFLMDGQPLSIEEILKRLRCGVCDEIDANRYRKLRVKNWSERGIAVAQNSSSIKLGHACLSHDMLDAALDAEV